MKRYQSLKGKKAFKEVLDRGRKYKRSEIQLIALKTSDSVNIVKKVKNDNIAKKYVRIGIQIGKKYGNAVIRNRTKRKIRAICSEILQRVEEDCFIIIRPGDKFKSLNHSDSKKIIASLLTEAGFLISDRS